MGPCVRYCILKCYIARYFLVMPYICSVGRVARTNKRKVNCLEVETLYVMIYFYRMELLTVNDSSN
jgi:hypothetical protein